MGRRITMEDDTPENTAGAMEPGEEILGQAKDPVEHLPKPESALRLRAAMQEVGNTTDMLENEDSVTRIPFRAKEFCEAWEEFEAARIQCKAEAQVEQRRVMVG